MEEPGLIQSFIQSFRRVDKYGAELRPGDVCVWGSKNGAVICVYKSDSPGGKTGKYGQFYTISGIKSIAYKSVIGIYDPIGKGERINHDVAKELLRRFYG